MCAAFMNLELRGVSTWPYASDQVRTVDVYDTELKVHFTSTAMISVLQEKKKKSFLSLFPAISFMKPLCSF